MSPEACAIIAACAFVAGAALVVIVEAVAGRPPRNIESGDRGRS